MTNSELSLSLYPSLQLHELRGTSSYCRMTSEKMLASYIPNEAPIDPDTHTEVC